MSESLTTQASLGSDPTSGLTLERTKELVHDFCKTFPIAYAIGFKIRTTQEELYGQQASPDQVGRIFGGFVPATRSDQQQRPLYRGRCDLAYSVIGDEVTLRRTLAHEIAGHFGLSTCSADEKRAILESISLSRQAPGIEDLWNRAQKNYANHSDLQIAEEVYSAAAEEFYLSSNWVAQVPDVLQRLNTQGAQSLKFTELFDIVAYVATGLHENTRDQVIFPETSREQFAKGDAKPPYHEVVAAQLIAQIQAGTAPWQKPWSAQSDQSAMGFMPFNPATGKRYRGMNAVYLMAQGRGDPRWLTYKQAASLGAQVKKGERATSIQYWKFEETRDKLDENGRPILDAKGEPLQDRIRLENPRLFFATVFNGEQIDGLPVVQTVTPAWDPVERAESILSNSAVSIHHAASSKAYYNPVKDEIHLPLRSQFDNAAAYYATALHELGHWTGHDSRLGRDLAHPFGSEGYAKEELRAEIASMLLSGDLGLPHDVAGHASYVASWVKVLRDDPLEIFRAAFDAEKIHGYVMGFSQAQSQEQEGQSPTPTPSGLMPLQALAQTEPTKGQLLRTDSEPPFSPIVPAKDTIMATKRFRSDTPLSTQDVQEALSYISPNMARDDWAKIGMSIKSRFADDTGLALFDQWSATGDGYSSSAVTATWRSIRATGRVTIGTLIRQAQQNGYQLPVQSTAKSARSGNVKMQLPPVQPVQLALQEPMPQEQLVIHKGAAQQAQTLWGRALAEASAPYLERKGVMAHGTRTTSNGTLLVPLMDDQGEIWNVQRILPTPMDDGTDKLYLKDGRKSSLFHVIGVVSDEKPVVFAEGYATAATVHEASGWPVVVCFDAGNLSTVAANWRQANSQALMLIAGDDDLPTLTKRGYNPGRDKASAVAKQTGAALAFPTGLDPKHSDFNDLLAQLGKLEGHKQVRTSLHLALTEFSASSPEKVKIALNALRDLEQRGVAQLTEPVPQNAPVPTVAVASPVQADGLDFTDTSTETINPTPTPTVVLAPGLVATQTPFTMAQPQTTPQASAILQSVDNHEVPLGNVQGQMLAEPVDSRFDPYNQLNLEGLAAKRRFEAEQASSQDSVPAGGGVATPSPANSAAADSVDTARTQTPEQLEQLKLLRQRLASEYQFDGQSKYYFKHKPDVAFEDSGGRLQTVQHTGEVLSSMAQLAKAKGWSTITVNGTEEFRREMWLQSSLVGLRVFGYVPEPIDQVRLQERRALLQSDKQVNTVVQGQALDLANTAPASTGSLAAVQPQGNQALQDKSVQTPTIPVPTLLSGQAGVRLDNAVRAALSSQGSADPQAVLKTLGDLYTQVKSPRVYVGQVLEHGPGTYPLADDPSDAGSYYIKMQTLEGVQTVWGKDLPRALEELENQISSRAIGHPIMLAFQGRQKVSVPTQTKDPSGRIVTQWELVDRNAWLAVSIPQVYHYAVNESSQKTQTESTAPPIATAPDKSAAQGVNRTAQMRPLESPQLRLRNALAQIEPDPIKAEITLASLQALVQPSSRFNVGRLLEHGKAPFNFVGKGSPPSYYLKLSTDQGSVVLWSADFERAINKTPVQVGQTVVVAYKGIENVTDPGRQPVRRNEWLVAPLSTLNTQAQDGVVHRNLSPVMAAAQAPAPNAPEGVKSLYVLREAMRLAGIPDEYAAPTLRQAEEILRAKQVVNATPISPQTVPRSIRPSTVSKKVGPSL